jgi:hypothetical protein
VFDLRQTQRALHVLASQVDVPRTVRYTHDGRFLVVSEGADVVSMLDVAADYACGQYIELLGAHTPPRHAAGGVCSRVRRWGGVRGGTQARLRASPSRKTTRPCLWSAPTTSLTAW